MRGAPPGILAADGMNRLIRPAQEMAGRCGIGKFVHVCGIHLGGHHNHDSKQERLNGESEDGLSTTRGLGDENSALIRLMIACHSLFRPHSAPDGRTPAGAGQDQDTVRRQVGDPHH